LLNVTNTLLPLSCLLCTAEPLYAVCRGSGLTLTLTRPAIDCSLDNTGESSRLLNYFQEAGLWTFIKGRMNSSSSSSSIDNSRQQQEASTAAAAVLRQQDSKMISSKLRQKRSSSTNAGSAADAAVAGVNVQSHPILTHSDSLAAVEAEPPPTSTAEAAETAAAAAVSALSPVRQRLTQADASAQLSAELRLPRLSVYVPDGQLLLPQEVK
jgi:hypothetical protein